MMTSRSEPTTDEHSATESSHNKKRQSRSIKTLVIEPFTQIKLGLYVIALTVLFLLAAGWLFFSSFLEQYQHVIEIFEITDPETQWETITNNVFYSNLQKLVGLFAIFILSLLAVTFRVTHCYHGPLVSIERFARSIGNGKYYDRIQIRKRDELKSLVKELNKMADALEKKHGALVDEQGKSIRRRKVDEDVSSTDQKTHDSEKQDEQQKNVTDHSVVTQRAQG
ncbi:MAG: hypothetical protein OXC40_05255 [Proteobacteria bacterium]|nr:hypothetical protein [Pseudomonadota bacterium]